MFPASDCSWGWSRAARLGSACPQGSHRRCRRAAGLANKALQQTGWSLASLPRRPQLNAGTLRGRKALSRCAFCGVCPRF